MLKFRVLMDRLRDRLLNENDLAKGKLPSLLEIAKQENCSLSTVQRAIQELKKEGVVMTKTGQGTFSVAAYPFEDMTEQAELPVRFINCCGFSMSGLSMLRDFYNSLDEAMFKRGRSIHSYSLIKKNGVIVPLSERDLSISVCGTFLFSPFNDDILNNLLLQCKNVISIDRDLTSMGVDSLVNDNIASGMMAANHLFELGHTDIAYIGSYQSEPEANGFDPALAERFRGFKTAFMLKNMKMDESICYPIKKRTFEGCIGALDELLASGKKFTAIVTFISDKNGFVEYLKSKNLKVPQDISLVTAGKSPSPNDDNKMTGAVFTMHGVGPIALDMMNRRIEKTGRGVSRTADNVELYAIPPVFDVGETMGVANKK